MFPLKDRGKHFGTGFLSSRVPPNWQRQATPTSESPAFLLLASDILLTIPLLERRTRALGSLRAAVRLQGTWSLHDPLKMGQ